MRLRVEKDGEPRTLALDRYNVRAGGAMAVKVVELGGANRLHEVEDAIRTYRGYCEEEPDAIVSAMVLPSGGVRYWVFKGDPHEDWGFIPREEFELGAEVEIPHQVLTGPPEPRSGVPMEGASFTAQNAAGDPLYDQVYRAHIGLIVNKSYLDGFGYEDPALVVRKVESTMARMNHATLRDGLIETVISGVLIRTDRDAEWEGGWGTFHGAFSDLYPNTVMTLTNERGSGLTYLCATGGENAPDGVNGVATGKSGPGDDGTWYGVMRHEYGHSLGSNHYEGGAPEGPTIMSGNRLSRFSGYEVRAMVDCRQTASGDAARFNEALGHYAEYPIPPYARVDDRIGHVVAEGELVIDVLGNDHDVNGDEIALSSIESPTGLGGVVALRAGEGPGGRDVVAYLPPADVATDVAVSSCPSGTALSPDDCVTCVSYIPDGAPACSGTGDCGAGQICAGGACRLAPGCGQGEMTNACGHPCPGSALLLWLDASDLENLVDVEGARGDALAHGAELATWTDQSGRGNDAVVYTEGKAPQVHREGQFLVADRSVVRFEQDFMEIRGLDVRPETLAGFTSIAVTLHSSGVTIWVQQQNGFEKREHETRGVLGGTVGLSTLSVDGQTESRFANRVEHDTSPAERAVSAGGASIALGALLYAAEGYEGAYHPDFTLAELLLFEGVLSDSQRAAIENYLVAKWRITLRDRFWYGLVDTSGLESRAPVFIDLQ
jgi:hypothetical protein